MAMPETRHPIGQLLDARGVTAEITDSDLISDVIVLMKVVDEDGMVGLILETSEGCDWINQLGMMDAAKTIIGAGTKYADEDDG